MKLDAHNNEIKYIETLGQTTIFGVILDGELTMRILCRMDDEKRTIVIARPDSADVLETKGRFEMVEKLLEGPDGSPLGVETRVDRKSVYRYILPRLHTMLGRLLRAA